MWINLFNKLSNVLIHKKVYYEIFYTQSGVNFKTFPAI